MLARVAFFALLLATAEAFAPGQPLPLASARARPSGVCVRASMPGAHAGASLLLAAAAKADAALEGTPEKKVLEAAGQAAAEAAAEVTDAVADGVDPTAIQAPLIEAFGNPIGGPILIAVPMLGAVIVFAIIAWIITSTLFVPEGLERLGGQWGRDMKE